MSQGRSVPARGASGQNEPQIQALTLLGCNLGAACPLFDIMRVTDFSKLSVFPQPAKPEELQWKNVAGFSKIIIAET